MAQVAIVGCGDVGTALGVVLHQKGHRVVGFNRTGTRGAPPFGVVQGDVTDRDSFVALGTGYDVVFYTAAPGGADPEAYRAVYETGLRNLVTHFRGAPARPAILLTTSTGVYGQRRGEWVDEESPTKPGTASGEMLVAAEGIVAEAWEGNVSVRLGGIYGAGRNWLVQKSRSGEPVQKDPPYFTNRIHRDDCAGVLAHLLDLRMNGMKLSPCYVAVDDDPASMWDVVSWLRKTQGLGAPTEKQTDTGAGGNKRCSNGLLKATGYRFIYSTFKEGYRGIVSS